MKLDARPARRRARDSRAERMKTIWRTTAGLGAEGPNGAVMPQRVLEWMQDAAANASTLAGHPPERYRALGAGWFVKELSIAIDRPIRYRDPIAIETWVSDFRRFRSRRDYRLYVNDTIAARAFADWMLLERDPDSGRVRPLRADQELLAAFPIDPEHAIERDEIPSWNEQAIEAIDRRTVRATELDRHRHVNHTVYLGWVEDHVRAMLGDETELKCARIEYESDAKLGDEIGLETWRIPGCLQHRVMRNGQRLVKIVTIREVGSRL
jgi:acyl-CoA thioester hydrolase